MYLIIRGGICVFYEPEKPDFRFRMPLFPLKTRVNPDFRVFMLEFPTKNRVKPVFGAFTTWFHQNVTIRPTPSLRLYVSRNSCPRKLHEVRETRKWDHPMLITRKHAMLRWGEQRARGLDQGRQTSVGTGFLGIGNIPDYQLSHAGLDKVCSNHPEINPVFEGVIDNQFTDGNQVPSITI